MSPDWIARCAMVIHAAAQHRVAPRYLDLTGARPIVLLTLVDLMRLPVESVAARRSRSTGEMLVEAELDQVLWQAIVPPPKRGGDGPLAQA